MPKIKYKWDYVIAIWNNMHACHESVNFKLYNPTKIVNVNDLYLNGYMTILPSQLYLKHM
jgi:hypothetical protein